MMTRRHALQGIAAAACSIATPKAAAFQDASTASALPDAGLRDSRGARLQSGRPAVNAARLRRASKRSVYMAGPPAPPSKAASIARGMIFVPSVDGISHSPRELTPWDDCARGADVLLDTVLAMDED